MLVPLLKIYQMTTRNTWWKHTNAEWDHIERYERSGAKQQFEEAGVLREASPRAIEKAACLPDSRPVLERMRGEMASEMNSYDPMTDDGAHQIAARNGYSSTIELIDRLMA